MNEIQLYNFQISIDELTDLIHRSYRQLAKFGFKYWGTHQSTEDTKIRISEGECYIATIDDKVVGTNRLKFLRKLG